MTRRRALRTATTVVVLVLVVGSGTAVAAIPGTGGPGVAVSTAAIGACTTITEPGYYELDAGVTYASTVTSTPCIRITADDVVLDGRGNTFAGRGITATTGILVDGGRNVTVRDVKLTDWHRAVEYDSADGGSVTNVTAESNVYGIVLTESTAVSVTGNTLSNNFVGVHTRDSARTVFERNRFVGNGVAFDAPGPSERTRGPHDGPAVGSIRVGAGVTLSIGPPMDADGDGRYEDVTGDGKRSVVDRLALTVIVTADTVGLADVTAEQGAALDFDGDDRLGYGDVLAFG